MIICLDYQPAVAQGAGIGRYARLLAAELSAILPAEDSLSLFYYDFKRKVKNDNHRLESLCSHRKVKNDNHRLESLCSHHPFRLLPGRVMEAAMTRFGLPKFDWIAGRADIYHFTNFVAKPVGRGKSVASIHDMSFARFPQFADAKNLRHLERGLKRTAAEASRIITISEFSRREIEDILPETRGRVRTTPLGISEDFKPASVAEIEEVKRRMGLTRPFVLTVGTVEPRKNLSFLADVFERIAPHGIDFVVAGAPGWKCEQIMSRFEEAQNKFPGRFHYARFVPDGMLTALYSAASLFAVASHYEGFGFPPLEALACGTPVISSDGGSLPEVLGENAEMRKCGNAEMLKCGNAEMRKCGVARIMRGFDADEWASAALEIIASPPDPAIGIAHTANYRWSECARKTLEIYREAYGT